MHIIILIHFLWCIILYITTLIDALCTGLYASKYSSMLFVVLAICSHQVCALNNFKAGSILFGIQCFHSIVNVIQILNLTLNSHGNQLQKLFVLLLEILDVYHPRMWSHIFVRFILRCSLGKIPSFQHKASVTYFKQ